MAGAAFVYAGDNRINDLKLGQWTDALRRDAVSRSDRTISAHRMLQRPHDGGANGNHAAPTLAWFDQGGRIWRNVVRLVERQTSIEIRIAR